MAADSDEAERFWKPRKQLGAIAARTNAFKLNEDIVLPLHALADFARYIDRYNVSEDRYTQKSIIRSIRNYLGVAAPVEGQDWLEARIPRARELCDAALETLAASEEAGLRQKTLNGQLLRDRKSVV